MSRGRVRIEDGHKPIRVCVSGEVVADTTHPKLMWEKPYYATYYFPEADIHLDGLVPSGHTNRSPSRRTAEVFDVKSPPTHRQAGRRSQP